MKYYAHSENIHNEKHSLSKHLHQTAKFADSFTCQEIYKSIFKVAGLLHDLGKYQPAFQSYLENGGKRGSVPHASWGAGYARLCRLIEASIAIDGHHKGLPDNSAWKSDTEAFNRKDVTGFENVVKAFISDTETNEEDIKKQNSLVFTEKSQREVFVRCLFSALTDSDWLSTEKHFKQDTFKMRLGATLPV
ncbi:MAG: CRISPR-associated endonuclease Cas3'', partial [Deltaproteobacteria bacterium]|nr:CRISPR-associated endonuclease Cas3'' [Deltaproteobacteria bacterium]